MASSTGAHKNLNDAVTKVELAYLYTVQDIVVVDLTSRCTQAVVGSAGSFNYPYPDRRSQ